MSWADYLFPTLEKALKEARFGVVEDDILRMMREHDHGYTILEEDGNIYEKGNTLKSFHHQAHQSISRKTLLVSFLSVWLKRRVVPSPPHDALFLTILLSTVRLLHSRYLKLLSAIVRCI